MYENNEAFQKALLEKSTSPDALTLTSGGRLARHLKHRYRQQQIEWGGLGWPGLNVLTLNAWMHRAWQQGWPGRYPLSYAARLLLWKEAADAAPPPAPLVVDTALLEALDETYAVLVRHGLSLEPDGQGDVPLALWRRRVTSVFLDLGREKQGFHPAHLPARVAEAILKGAVAAPETIALAAFEAPAPLEESLFKTLGTACRVTRFDLPEGRPQKVTGRVLPNREQETAWLVRALVKDAQEIPLHRIAVIVPDTEAYLPSLRRTLQDIVGPSGTQHRWSYNISAGVTLAERPLAQAGLLPLRFWNEGQSRALLLSMILSPYYGRWALERDQIARADRIWRQEGRDVGLGGLLADLAHRSADLHGRLQGPERRFETLLRDLVGDSPRPCAAWIAMLKRFWTFAGYPVLSDEADAGAWNHLQALLEELEKELQAYPLDGGAFAGFLGHLMRKEAVHVQGSEERGIQILGLLESRGLSFERLYVLGLSQGSLPRPVRDFPLLTAWERKRVQGATPESQFEFARCAFGHLMACANNVVLTRPEEAGTEPLVPSPFWFETITEEIREVVNPWNTSDPVWARALWLRETAEGLKNRRDFPPADPPLVPAEMPETFTVSELSTAFACPFRFFAESVLCVVPLERPALGISPKDRGKALHKTLALFTAGCRDAGLMSKRHRSAMMERLEECARRAIGLAAQDAEGIGEPPLATTHGWRLEVQRWVAQDAGAPALLAKWLDAEIDRTDEGWQWLCEEVSFEGLTCPQWPFSVSGRIDRIDFHEEKGIMLWDYKTGDFPTRRAVIEALEAPQIPLYMMAAREGRIGRLLADQLTSAPVLGGHIGLKRASEISHKAITPEPACWDEVLERWRAAVAELGRMLAEGRFAAKPYPVSESARTARPCGSCPYAPLCAREEDN